MEIKEAERVVIAKPVASRPTCSNFRSFSELLEGAINASPPNACSETAIATIRPKTVRFKPVINRAPVPAVSSQVELSGMAGCSSSDKVVASDSKRNVVYKPQAKLVSRRTVSLLANMGNLNNGQQQPLSSAETRAQPTNQEKHNLTLQPTSDLHQNTPSRTEADQTTEVSRLTTQTPEEDPKTLASASNCDRPSYDGYNWRKYGQKQVKGSEYPRSYYKCTHPNCPVKKKVERSFDGQIAEIVYKGEHNHSKPQPPKRNSAGTQGVGLVSDGTGQDPNNQTWTNLNDRNEGSEVRVENQNAVVLPIYPTYQSNAPPARDPAGTGSINAGAGTSDNSCGLSGECDEGSKGLEGDDEEPRSKRRKKENQSTEAVASVSGVDAQEGRVVVQSSTDSEIMGDGFRWRKYGQKVVKGNPYPRSYYRCTTLKCNVRKHVERASDDPTAFITTYEGKHNHEMPLRSSAPAPAASEPDSQGPLSKVKP